VTQRYILRVGGTREELARAHTLAELKKKIGCQTIDVVNLNRAPNHRGMVMLVDDTGFVDGKPRNEAATALYQAVCRPGTTHYIAGDVAVVPDGDYA
jgi:hypothetical protein